MRNLCPKESQQYEEEILELAAQEGARQEEGRKGRRIGRIKRLYEERLKAFTHEKAGRDGERRMRRTAHENRFSEEGMTRRKLLVGMKRSAPH